ncbi:DUF2797 domain-containing protein [Flavobacterium agricola]|uniref:DUF2797 domain-containing protein n=1 Tax=Flavobacterium agricola TaxID=2870839 RepID=A0ABY6LZ27_9FLAO|nr:DUF2797 domain-containing protein [Flavobacterium agricola]UYW00690.1 DUF2797 domain-containing protein [Flavobacterium agricola]
MVYEGVLEKMPTEFAAEIQYYLPLQNGFIHLNQILNKEIQIQHTGFECLSCHANKKIFRQGFCYDCFYKNPEAGDWIMKPELSKAHLGVADRDLAYEQKVQLQPHIVYLATSSDIKVGVTRKTQMPTRWIDQGATGAIPLIEVPNRYLAGITEVALKDFYTDKTSWQKMLKNDVGTFDLLSEREKAFTHLPDEVKPYFETTAADLFTFNYPVLQYPKKVSSLNLDKAPLYTGVLMGIKGQYLIFEDGTVFNIRSNEGYKVRITL